MSVAVPEPRFTRAEVDILLASRRKDQEPRGSHGYTLAEATNPDNQGRFYVDLPTTDFAQQAYERGRDAYRKKYGKDAEMGSLLFRVKMRD